MRLRHVGLDADRLLCQLVCLLRSFARRGRPQIPRIGPIGPAKADPSCRATGIQLRRRLEQFSRLDVTGIGIASEQVLTLYDAFPRPKILCRFCPNARLFPFDKPETGRVRGLGLLFASLADGRS